LEYKVYNINENINYEENINYVEETEERETSSNLLRFRFRMNPIA